MSGSICFTESMRGRVTGPAPFSGTALELLDLQVVLPGVPAQGQAGMCGNISAGRLLAPGLCSEALEVAGGSVEILRKLSPRNCEMRYLLQCRLPGSGRQFRLQGCKQVNHHSGLLWPRAIWVETTTLKLELLELPGPHRPDGAGAAPVLAGVLRIRLRDFVRQLASLRSTNPLGRRAALRDLLQFLRFFVRRLWEVYGFR